MSTTNAAVEPTATTGAQAEPKTKRFFSVTLRGTDESTLRITASLKRDGSASSYATHSTKGTGGKRTNKRGATEKHENMAQAKATVEKLAASAVKLGWTRGKASGFTAKPDAFDASHLPAPGASAKAGTRK